MEEVSHIFYIFKNCLIFLSQNKMMKMLLLSSRTHWLRLEGSRIWVLCWTDTGHLPAYYNTGSKWVLFNNFPQYFITRPFKWDLFQLSTTYGLLTICPSNLGFWNYKLIFVPYSDSIFIFDFRTPKKRLDPGQKCQWQALICPR